MVVALCNPFRVEARSFSITQGGAPRLRRCAYLGYVVERLRRNASVTQYHEATIVANTNGAISDGLVNGEPSTRARPQTQRSVGPSSGWAAIREELGRTKKRVVSSDASRVSGSMHWTTTRNP